MKASSATSSPRVHQQASAESTPKSQVPSKPKDTISQETHVQEQEHKEFTKSIEEFFVHLAEALSSFAKTAWAVILNLCGCFQGNKTTPKAEKDDKQDKAVPDTKRPERVETPKGEKMGPKSQGKAAVANYKAILVSVQADRETSGDLFEGLKILKSAIAQGATQAALLDLIQTNCGFDQGIIQQMTTGCSASFEGFKKSVLSKYRDLLIGFHIESLKLFLQHPANPIELQAVFKSLPKEVRALIIAQYSEGITPDDVTSANEEEFLQLFLTPVGAEVIQRICRNFQDDTFSSEGVERKS